MVMTERQANRLAGASSPYLLQHAHNPVDWFPWGEEAFAKARSEDRPVFLSVGYAACHWCHVMERESFEDETTAKLLNERFVAIKVDREERPDVDGIYMDAVQAMYRERRMADVGVPHARSGSRSTPARTSQPSHATGCQRSDRCSRRIADAWATRRDEVRGPERSRDRVDPTRRARWKPPPSRSPAPSADEAFQTLRHSFDPRCTEASAARRSSRNR